MHIPLSLLSIIYAQTHGNPFRHFRTSSQGTRKQSHGRHASHAEPDAESHLLPRI